MNDKLGLSGYVPFTLKNWLKSEQKFCYFHIKRFLEGINIFLPI